MKAAGLQGYSTHKLRHTAATLMYQTGTVDVLTLKEVLGHSNVSTTQIYTHLKDAQVRAAVEANPLGSAHRKKPAPQPSARNASGRRPGPGRTGRPGRGGGRGAAARYSAHPSGAGPGMKAAATFAG